MSTTDSTLTLVSEIPLPLAKAKELDGLAVDSSASLVKAFAPSFTSLYALIDEANAITDDEPAAAKAMRLKIVKVRTNADRVRVALKEDSKRISGAIDGINKLLLNDLTPVEKRLEDIEKREARLQAARITTLADTRRAELSTLTDISNLVHYDLGNMPAASYTQLHAGLKAAKEALAKADAERIEAAKKAEADRAAKEKADAIERARLAAENARLAEEARKAREAQEATKKAAEAQAKALADKAAAEQAKRDAQAAKEKAARDAEAKKLADIQAKKDADAKAALDAEKAKQAKKDAEAEKERADLEAKAKAAQAELEAQKAAQAKREADAKAVAAQKLADEAAAAKRAAKAPDKSKLLTFAASIKALPIPVTTDPALNTQLTQQASKMVAWVEGWPPSSDRHDPHTRQQGPHR